MKGKEKTIHRLQETTLCYLIKENQVLLAMKKRGFGAGRYNGIGGKVKEKESLEETLVREASEEIGVKPISFKRVAVLDFLFPEVPRDKDWNQRVNVFLIKEWEGEPEETEEMKPGWFPIDDLPFDKMWVDDKIWLARVLAGETLKGEFIFAADQKTILKHSIKKAT